MKYNVINTIVYVISTIVFFIYTIVDDRNPLLYFFEDDGFSVVEEPVLAAIIYLILVLSQTICIAQATYEGREDWWKFGIIWIPGVSCLVNLVSWVLIFGITMVFYGILALGRSSNLPWEVEADC